MACSRCKDDVLAHDVRLSVGHLYEWHWSLCRACAQAIALAASRAARTLCTHRTVRAIEVTIIAGALFTWGWRRCQPCAHAIGCAAVAVVLQGSKPDP
jgi:hypothetical protein